MEFCITSMVEGRRHEKRLVITPSQTFFATEILEARIRKLLLRKFSTRVFNLYFFQINLQINLLNFLQNLLTSLTIFLINVIFAGTTGTFYLLMLILILLYCDLRGIKKKMWGVKWQLQSKKCGSWLQSWLMQSHSLLSITLFFQSRALVCAFENYLLFEHLCLWEKMMLLI